MCYLISISIFAYSEDDIENHEISLLMVSTTEMLAFRQPHPRQW